MDLLTLIAISIMISFVVSGLTSFFIIKHFLKNFNLDRLHSVLSNSQVVMGNVHKAVKKSNKLRKKNG